jgi:TP901 family phage tail tape measure protein
MDSIELPIVATPKFDTFDAAIKRLEELSRKGFTIPIHFNAETDVIKAQTEKLITGLKAQWAGLTTDINSKMRLIAGNLDAMGSGWENWAVKAKAGFASVSEEFLFLNGLMREMDRRGDVNPLAGLTRDLATARSLQLTEIGGQAADAGGDAQIRKQMAMEGAIKRMGVTKKEAAVAGKVSAEAEIVALKSQSVAQEQATKSALRFTEIENAQAVAVERVVAALSAQDAMLRQKALAYTQVTSAAAKFTGEEALQAAAGKAATLQILEQSAAIKAKIVALNQASAAAARPARALTGGGGSGEGFLGGLGGTVANAAKFIAVYKGIDLVVGALKSGATAAIDIEKATAGIEVVFRGTAEEARALSQGTLDLAVAQGQSAKDALDAATLFARAGYTKVEALEAVRVSLMGANTAEITTADSAKHFSAIITAWELGARDLEGTLDKLNGVSNKSKASMKDLLEGFSRVAPFAKQAGLSISETTGILASAIERTARPGGEIGNTLKSIIARSAKPETKSYLKDALGIDTATAGGELRPFGQILEELATKFHQLGSAEKQEAAEKIAGTNQVSKFTAILDGYTRSVELTGVANNSAGVSAAENARKLDTLAKALESLKTQWSELFASMGRAVEGSGIQSFLKEMARDAAVVLRLITFLSEGIQNGIRGQAQNFNDKKNSLQQSLFGGKSAADIIGLTDADKKRLQDVQRQVNEKMRAFMGAVSKPQSLTAGALPAVPAPDAGEPTETSSSASESPAVKRIKDLMAAQKQAMSQMMNAMPSFGREDAVNNEKMLLSYQQASLDVELQKMNVAQASGTLQTIEANLMRAKIRDDREALETEKQALQIKMEFARQEDAIKRGIGSADAVRSAYGGRSDAERNSNLVRGLTAPNAAYDPVTKQPLNVGAAQIEFYNAKGPVEQAMALARLKEMGLMADKAAAAQVENVYAARIKVLDTYRKQNEEATKSLLMGDREMQLRAAMAAKFSQGRGGKGFSADEFMFLDQKTKQTIEQTSPDLLPPELRTNLRDASDEFRLAAGSVNALTMASDNLKTYIENLQSANPIAQNAPGGSFELKTDGLQDAINAAGTEMQNACNLMSNTVVSNFQGIADAMNQMNARISGLGLENFTSRIGVAQGAGSGL